MEALLAARTLDLKLKGISSPKHVRMTLLGSSDTSLMKSFESETSREYGHVSLSSQRKLILRLTNKKLAGKGL